MFLSIKNVFVCTSILGFLTINSLAQDDTCPLPEESVPLTDDLSIRAVRNPADGTLRVEMTSSLGGWIGFALADSNTMVGNTAVIGRVGIAPSWYDLNGKSLPGVVIREDETLEGANWEITDAGTILSFTIPLDSADDSDVGYIFAAGETVTLSYHGSTTRGFRSSAFVSCASMPAEPEEPSPPGPDAPVPTESPQAPAPEPTETTAAPVVAPTQPTAPAPTSSGRSVLNQKGWFVTSLSIAVAVVTVTF